MPVYEYKCTGTCHGIIIKQRSIKENDPGYDCESCFLPLERIYSSVGAIFTGPGFYSTDNKSK
jgi:putative FmdB family regulatory protein